VFIAVEFLTKFNSYVCDAAEVIVAYTLYKTSILLVANFGVIVIVSPVTSIKEVDVVEKVVFVVTD
jgi:hypothetical protein